MNKLIKFAFLVVTLLLPVMIFTFLKLFGNNKFDVEIMYLEGVPERYQNECSIGSGQYAVSDFVLDQGKGLKIVAFDNDAEALELKNISIRLSELFKETISFRVLSTVGKESVFYKTISVSVEDYRKYVSCNFILEDLNKLVLLDSKNRIRGYYSRDLDEIDRLIVEMKILLENGVD